MVVCYSYYINEVFKTISNLQKEASELNKAVKSFNFIDAQINILRELQGIVDFINFIQSHPIDFNKSLLKCLQILEKIVSKNEIKDIEEVNHIIRLLKKVANKENSLFDDYDKIQKKLIKIRIKLFNLYEKNKKKNICKAFNYISLANYYYISFPKPNTLVSYSIFKFLFLLQSFSINIKNITADKGTRRDTDLQKWSQITIENIHDYSKLIKDYNSHDNNIQSPTAIDLENKVVNKSKLTKLLSELDEIIESSKGLGFDKLCSHLQKSKEDLIEKLQIDDSNDINDNDNESDEKQIGLSMEQKDVYTSVYSSFYSDDLDSKYSKSLPTKCQRNRYASCHMSPLALNNVGSNGQISTFNSTSLFARDSDSQDISASEFRSLDLSYQRRRSRKNLTSSHSMFRLSPMNSSSLSSSSFSFRVSSRKPILIVNDSPIKIKPSGRHLTFSLPNEDDLTIETNTKTKRRPSINPYPSNVDTELLMPYLPNPPFAGWNISYFLQKVTFSTLPTINYNSNAPKFQFSIFNFHLPSIKQLLEETSEEPSYLASPDELKENEGETEGKKTKSKKRKSLIHFRKKKKEEKHGKEKDRNSSPKRKSWFKKSEMDKKSSAVIKEANLTLRKCWKNLRNAKNKKDQFGRIQAVSEWYKIVYSYVPTLVKYSRDFPNNEFIVDAVREYERIRVEFDEILNEIEFIKGQTMVESIQQSAKQLSMILVSLDIYINDESVTSKSKLLSTASKVMGYLTNVLCNLQIICDCLDPSSFIACSEFILNLWRALKLFYPVFSDLEAYVKKSILAFSMKSILLTLKPAIMLLHQIENNLIFSKSNETNNNNVQKSNESLTTDDISFTDEQIKQQVAYLKKVSIEFLNTSSIISNNGLYVTMIADLFKEMLELDTFMNPLYITDLNELGNIIESTFIEMQLQNESNPHPNQPDNSNDSEDSAKTKTISEEFNVFEKEVLTTSELKKCMIVLAAVRKLQFMLTVKLGAQINIENEEEKESIEASGDESSSKASGESDASNTHDDHSSITNREFINLVTQNQSDFSELADLIQVNSSELYSSNSLRVLTKNWFESIFQITFSFVDLLKVSPILNKQPCLYSQVDSYYELLIESIQFFKNTAKAKINVSIILDHLMANLRHTQYYSRIKPFEIIAEDDDNSQQDEDQKKKEKKKKDNEKKSDVKKENNCLDLKKFTNFPLFESQFDLEKYKCGFYVNRIPIYKRALFADFIKSIVIKLREPHSIPEKTMDYLTSLYIQIFTSLVNISNQLRKDEGKVKNESENNQNDKKQDEEKNKDYFLLLLINRERDNILHFQYSEEKSSYHYGIENREKLTFLLHLGEFIAKYIEFASVLSDEDQLALETRKKKSRKRQRKKNKTDPNTRQRRGRVGEEFTIEVLTMSDSDNKLNSSDLEDNPDGDYSNNEGDNYSDCSSSSSQTETIISKDAKNKLKELRQSIKTAISNLKKFDKKSSKNLVQPFNIIIRSKPSNIRTLFMSSETFSSTLIQVLESIQRDLKLEIEMNESSFNKSSESNESEYANSIIIAQNESSCSLGDNEDDKEWFDIKEAFDSIISPLRSITNNHDIFKTTEESENDNDNDNNNNDQDDDDDDEDRTYTAGVYFEQIFSDIMNIPLILECPFEKSARLFARTAQKIAKYAQKSLHIPYSEPLTKTLIDQFINLLHTTRNRYLHQYKLQQEKNTNDDENNSVNFIINENVDSEFKSLQKTSKILLQRELIENSNDQNLLLLILSQKLVEQASQLHPSSEDYSFVLKTITNLSVAVLNGYADINNKNLNFESLKKFVASFDYFIETLAKEMDNDVLSDDILLVINEFEKLQMKLPGYYAPKFCLRFLLIEADYDEDEEH